MEDCIITDHKCNLKFKPRKRDKLKMRRNPKFMR